MAVSIRSTFARVRRAVAFLARNERGSVAIYTAAAAVILVGSVGIGVDAARGFLLKAKLSQALDAAALAGGKVMLTNNRDSDIEMYFNANFPNGYLGSTVQGPVITPGTNTVTLSATATISTVFGGLFGIDTLTAAASTQVTRALSALDVVLSIDMSGSMCQPCTKIQGVRDSATQLVNTLFGSDSTSPTITVSSKTYNLLNIGLVPWNAKVNVTTDGKSVSSLVSRPVTTFTNPITGQQQSNLWFAANSPVPLLNNPTANGNGAWKGCVYARYIGDADNNTDGDLMLGQASLGTGSAQKQWMGWEAIPTLEGESMSGSWNSTTGGTVNGTTWSNQSKSCYQAYWNDTTTNSVPKAITTYLNNAGIANTNGTPGTTSSYYKWYAAVPAFGGASSNDCSDCLNVGITALQTQKSKMLTAINALQSPNGSTDIVQGLFWAYEVLMPEDPFNEAAPDPLPFPRRRAIVLLTDGENNGGNGDAYKGRFGNGTTAGTNGNVAHGTLPSEDYWPSGKQNNLDNRLLKLAAQIKGPAATRIYVIQYSNPNQNTTDLLKQVASGPDEPYYFNAPDNTQLQAAFQKIAADLSNLRLTQ